MNLFFNRELAQAYRNPSQVARVLTEAWLKQNGFCANCGSGLEQYENNRPVADFYCPNCAEQFELKSRQGERVGKKVADGAYRTMIERIQAANNPNFFFMRYRKSDYSVRQLLLVPKHYFHPNMIIRRKPLPPTAKRAGWIGCSIDISRLPESGQILLVDQAQPVSYDKVHRQWQQNLFLRKQASSAKDWLTAIMQCVESLPELHFSLSQMYAFVPMLQSLFPNNHHVEDKIRQQLQILRENGIIEFLGRGHYRKCVQQ